MSPAPATSVVVYEGNQHRFDDGLREGAPAETEFGALDRLNHPGGAFKVAWSATIS